MFFKQLNRLQQIDQLIRQQRTGNAESLAKKLEVSRRQVYNYLEELKALGLKIDYNREVKSFVYARPYRIDINIDIRDLSQEEAFKTEGGKNYLKKICRMQ